MHQRVATTNQRERQQLGEKRSSFFIASWTLSPSDTREKLLEKMVRSQEVERIAKKLDKMVQKKKTVSKIRKGTFGTATCSKILFTSNEGLISIRFIRINGLGFNVP